MFCRPRESIRPVPSRRSLESAAKYGFEGRPLLAIKSLYYCSEVCVRVGGIKSKSFTVCVGHWQERVLLPLPIAYMNWTDSYETSQRECYYRNLQNQPFALCGPIVHLESCEQGFQHAFDPVSVACDQTTIKVRAKMTTVLCLSRNPTQSTLQVSGSTLEQAENFKYIGKVFMSDVRQEKEINVRIGKANADLLELYRSVVTKRKLLNTAKLPVFKSVFVPILTWS